MINRISQPIRPLIFGLVILVIASAILGCKRKEAWQEPAPEEVFRAFLMDWFRGEQQRAFEAIVESDRAALMAPLEQLKATHGADALPEDYQMLVVGRVNNPYDFKSIVPKQRLEAAPASGQQVELTLNFHDGRTGSATMVWSGERWLVDLPINADEAGGGSETPRDDEQPGSESLADTADADSPKSAPDAGAPDPSNTNLPTTPSKTHE